MNLENNHEWMGLPKKEIMKDFLCFLIDTYATTYRALLPKNTQKTKNKKPELD